MVECCPHCGKIPSIKKIENTKDYRKSGRYKVIHRCNFSKKKLSSNLCSSRNEAIKSWNKNVSLIKKYDL